MGDRSGYHCGRCGRWHDELPFSYHAAAPAYWSAQLEDDPESELGEEQCVIRGEHFFVRGLIRLPVRDLDSDFEWGVWVSLSRENFLRTSELWTQDGRENAPPMFGWVSSELPVYATSTLNLESNVHTQPVGLRPLIELQPTDHPLARQQREGITRDQVEEFAAELLHGA